MTKKFVVVSILIFTLCAVSTLFALRPRPKKVRDVETIAVIEKLKHKTSMALAELRAYRDEPFHAPMLAPPVAKPVIEKHMERKPATHAEQGYFQKASQREWKIRTDGREWIRTLSDGRWRPSKESERSSPRAMSDSFVKKFAWDLFGVKPDSVVFVKQDSTDRTRIAYQQYVDGYPVYGAGLVVYVEDGYVSRVQNDLSSLPVEEKVQSFEEREAMKDVKALLPGANMDHQERVVLYPLFNQLVLAQEFIVTAPDHGGKPSPYRVVYGLSEKAVLKKIPMHIQ
jgi:hypothetical protein